MTTRVANCPSGLSVGPAATRAAKPYVSGTMTHCWSVSAATVDIATTPEATTRADVSLTGWGNPRTVDAPTSETLLCASEFWIIRTGSAGRNPGPLVDASRSNGAPHGGVHTLQIMIIAVHTILYADDPQAARAFFRDVLDWANVDAHDGWLVFKTGPSEMGVHPTSGGGSSGDWSVTEHHEISLVCDDIRTTVRDLGERGAEFDGDVTEAPFGLVARLKVPGAGHILMYEPRHPTAFDLDD